MSDWKTGRMIIYLIVLDQNPLRFVDDHNNKHAGNEAIIQKAKVGCEGDAYLHGKNDDGIGQEDYTGGSNEVENRTRMPFSRRALLSSSLAQGERRLKSSGAGGQRPKRNVVAAIPPPSSSSSSRRRYTPGQDDVDDENSELTREIHTLGGPPPTPRRLMMQQQEDAILDSVSKALTAQLRVLQV